MLNKRTLKNITIKNIVFLLRKHDFKIIKYFLTQSAIKIKNCEVEYFVRTNRTSSATVEMLILRRVISLHKGLKGPKIVL